MRRAIKRLVMLVPVLLLVVIVACTPAPREITPAPQPTPTPTGEKANFRLLISDEANAIDHFASLNVTISSIGLQQGGEPHLVRMDYEASDGREIFLSFEDGSETLFGLLRMRIQAKPIPVLPQEFNGNLALIRELHIYGPEVPLSEQKSGAVQHKGLGKMLLQEAERLASNEFQAQQMVVLSGTGAKEYYRTEFGYSSQGNYMIKRLKPQIG